MAETNSSNIFVHRADYRLEKGIWRATCRICGYSVTDGLRRRAASIFRLHIRESAVIDLRELDDVGRVQLDAKPA